MTFPRYDEYKDSGVEWLGEVPKHWVIVPLAKTAISSASRFTDGDWIESKDISDEGIRYITTGNIGEGTYKEQGAGFITDEKFQDLGCTAVQPGDVLISRLNLPVGRACLCPDFGSAAVASVDVVICRPDEYFDRKFLVFVLSTKAHFFNMEGLARGTTMQRISRSVLGRVRFAFPPLPEQAAIASFLDHETAKIDDLVAEQQNLIALLKEKRQALISHAVTKGLDPDVAMKDSGVEWLGEVPAHWEVMPLKRDLSFLTSGSRGWASNYSDEGAVFVRIGNLTRNRVNLDLSDIQRVDVPAGSEGERTRVDEGDLLFSITAYLGSVAVVPADLETAYVSQHVALARLKRNNLDPHWVAYVTLSDVGKRYLAAQGYGGTKIQLSLDDIGNLVIPTPPVGEQREIVTVLSTMVEQVDALMSEASSTITLLQERRTALISAAVTGKFDVRNCVSRMEVAAA